MIKIGILGYGNLGKGVENAIKFNNDMELVAVFTRRNPNELKINSDADVVSVNEIEKWQHRIDVLIICGGSLKDLPQQTPQYAKIFNVIDSFDTHANIPTHFKNVNKEATQNKKVAIISVGWDPGLFSLNRLYMNAILPEGKDYTFWGKGVSQGHSDAIRKINGVIDARQYTIPIDKAVEEVRKGTNPNLETRDKHMRECFVVVDKNANKEEIEAQIKNMPNYFKDYETIVHFISQEELNKNHKEIPHGGIVIRSGKTKENHKQIMEYKLKLDSNPEFTSSVLLAYARAAKRLYDEKQFGCKTIFDIAPKYIINKTNEELISTML